MLAQPVTITTAQAITATGNTPTYWQADGVYLSVNINVTAIGGTPNGVFEVQWSNDGTAWSSAETADNFTAITAAKNVVKLFPIKARYYRLAWVVSGSTPSLTTTITAVCTLQSR